MLKNLFSKLALMLIFVLALSVSVCAKTVYLDSELGSDSNSGEQYDEAFATLDKAITAVSDGGEIVLVGDYVITDHYTEPKHEGEIVITSYDGKSDYMGKLYFKVSNKNGTNYFMSGPLTLKNLTVSMTNYVMLVAQFNAVKLDDGVEVENGEKYFFVIGGHHAPAADVETTLDSHVTINSGTIYKMCGFSRSTGAKVQNYTGTSYITINGGKIGDAYGGTLVTHYAGNTVVEVNGGEINALHLGGDATRRLLGDAKLTINGGDIKKVDVNNVISRADVYLMGGEIGSCDVTYGSDAVRERAAKEKETKNLYCNAFLFDEKAIASFKETFDSYENISKIYVKNGGKGSGASEKSPLGSIQKAFGKLSDEGGIIILVGSSTLEQGEYIAKSEITVIGESNAEIKLGGSYKFSGSIKFENVKFSENSSSKISITDGVIDFENGIELNLSKTDFVIGGSSVLGIEKGSVKSISFSGAKNAEVALADVKAESIEAAAGSVSHKLSLILGNAEIKKLSVNLPKVAVGIGAASSKVESFNIPEKLENGTLVYGKANQNAAAVKDKFAESLCEDIVYIEKDKNGSGCSPMSPMGSLVDAVAKLSGEGGSVVISGDYTVAALHTIAEHGGSVKITSFDGVTDYREKGTTLTVSANIVAGGTTVFEKLNIISTKAAVIYGKGYNLTLGYELVITPIEGTTKYLSVVGGFNKATTSKETNLTINSGDWEIVRGGFNMGGLVADGIVNNITINGGNFHDYFALGSRGTTSGKINATINGGTFYYGLYAIYEEDNYKYNLNYDVNIDINGGTFYSAISPAKSFDTTLHGSYTVNLNGGEFMHLTDLRGTELYKGDMSSKINIGNGININEEEKGMTTFQNPIRYNNADPNLLYNEKDGFYYYTCTGSTTIGIIKAANIADIKTNPAYTILSETGGINLWSPEIWYFTAEDVGKENEGWYMFISFDDGTTANQRMHVVKCLDGDNLLGRWGDPVTGEVNKPRKIVFPEAPSINVDSLCGGMSVSKINGKTYITYIGEADRGTPDFHQTVNICTFDNPWTMRGVPTTVCVPTEEWEMGGYGQSKDGDWYPKVVEGAAAVYGDNGEYYLMYTGSGYWTIYYQLSFLRFKGGDPLDANNWEKNGDPIFARSPEVNGCGHASYITDPFGTKWASYHGYLGPDASDKRWSHFEPMTVDANGVSIGNGSGMPNSLDTVYTVQANPMPVAKKITGFDNSGVVEESKFVKVRDYNNNFTDVTSKHWFAPFVKSAYEYGLANGTSGTKFSPDGKFAVSHALTAAANVHMAYTGGKLPAANAGEAWYMPYVNYCITNGIIKADQFNSYDANITRGDMAIVFASILPDSEYEAVKSGSNPDVTADMACYNAVGKLFKAGIVGGDAGTGNYRPNDEIARSEACVIFTRIALKTERVK